VKVPTRKSTNPQEQRRQAMQSSRIRAASVRTAFPKVAVIRLELDFVSGMHFAPSSQTFLLYPSAHAFFRFACPCADCDGDFNLTADVTEVVSLRPQTASDPGSSFAGQNCCQGVRRRDTAHSRPCGIELNFRIAVELAS
jgi:hypothetical protein